MSIVTDYALVHQADTKHRLYKNGSFDQGSMSRLAIDISIEFAATADGFEECPITFLDRKPFGEWRSGLHSERLHDSIVAVVTLRGNAH